MVWYAEVRTVFQSTLSMRRATCGFFEFAEVGNGISIHALHEESDPLTRCIGQVDLRFQSTLSMRRATNRRCVCD